MFRVKLEGINGVKAEFAAGTTKMKEIISTELEGMAKEWVAGAKRDAPKDQGGLVNAISYYLSDSNTSSGMFIGFAIVAQKFYAPFMEFGTKGKYTPIPGTEQIAAQFKGYKGGDIMEMLRAIVRWAHRKGIGGQFSIKTRKRVGSKITQFSEDYAVAWPILLSILRNGITPHPFFFKQQEIVWPKMVRNIQSRLERELKVSVILPGEIKRPRIITV